MNLEQAIRAYYHDFLFTDDLATYLNNNGFSGLTGDKISNFIQVNFRGNK